eukprot:13385834-Alexandrium_andersonii.AAC.1
MLKSEKLSASVEVLGGPGVEDSPMPEAIADAADSIMSSQMSGEDDAMQQDSFQDSTAADSFEDNAI